MKHFGNLYALPIQIAESLPVIFMPRRHCQESCLMIIELWDMSKQLTVLGKNLSDLNVSVEVPDIPSLGLKGGTYDIQRFIYWNFLKCFWNEHLGEETSVVTNYDWYSPSNARRYSEKEVRDLVEANGLKIEHFHQEEACHSGRFSKDSQKAK